jgi:hypothetical protein
MNSKAAKVGRMINRENDITITLVSFIAAD